MGMSCSYVGLPEAPAPTDPSRAVGVDRIIAPNGYVSENLIVSDHPIFADFARYVGDLRGR
jgi:hypothetical protein